MSNTGTSLQCANLYLFNLTLSDSCLKGGHSWFRESEFYEAFDRTRAYWTYILNFVRFLKCFSNCLCDELCIFFFSKAYSISKFWSNLRISVFNDWHLYRNWIRWTIYRNATFQTTSSGMVDITWKGNVTWCLNVVIKQFLYRFFFYNELFFYDLFRFLSSTVEHLHSKTGIRPAPGRANWICISLLVLSYNSSECYYAEKVS